MSTNKGLIYLGMLSGRGLDNGEEGAVMLANQVHTSENALVTENTLSRSALSCMILRLKGQLF